MAHRKAVLLELNPLSDVHVDRHLIPAHGRIPNTSIQNKPVLIYHAIFPTPPSASEIESHIAAVGVCKAQWRYPMYPEEHFHSTAHELLVVSSGRARVQFGGDDNPAAVTVEVACGDAMLVPAGVSHRMLEDIECNFEMVGAYQLEAEHWDMCYGKPEEDELIVRIKDLPWFDRDPLYGDQGPAVAC